MKKRIKSDEVDLIEVFINILNNKLKIIGITFIFIFISTALNYVFKPPLNAKTEIIPITIFENSLYTSFNSLLFEPRTGNDDKEILNANRIKKINRDYLLDFFIEEIQTKEIIIEAIINYQLIDRKKFNNEVKYLDEVKKKALKLNLIRPINLDNNNNDISGDRLNWIIEFKINDKKKWEDALSFIDNEINNKIQKYLKENFKIALNDLKMLNQFKIEDLNLKIKNAKEDYNTEIINQLAFLKEQALIARELNIENNTLEVENFNTSSRIISNLQTAKPYYMRGYSMIEKEIELIETRTNKNAFTKNLLILENKKRFLLEDKYLERIANLFKNTPIFSDNDFKAADIIYKNTEYKNSFSLIKTISIAGVFGILFGIFYVMISSAILNRN